MLIEAYSAWRTYNEDPQFATLRRFGILFRCLGGTNFKAADLTHADFSAAKLADASFAKAKSLERVNWRNAEGLKFAHLTGTILAEPKVLDLLVHGRMMSGGKAEDRDMRNFRGLDLHGGFLQQALLTDGDFTGADLSRADLHGADLTGANLTRANLLGADLSDAMLTGACLADWMIDETTRLDGAKAAFVYLGPDNTEREPPSGEFAEGEFAKLFQAAAKTLDFIVKDRLELDALLQAAKALREQTPELELAGIEKKGDSAKVSFSAPPEFDREALYAEFKCQHDSEIKLLKAEYEAKQIGYENRIADLKELFRLEIQRTLINQEYKPVNNPQMFNHSPITQSGQGNVLNLGEISGHVSTAINQLPTPTPGQPDLQGLLRQLQGLIEQAPDLSGEDKASALKKIGEIAHAGQSPETGKGAAKDALRFFKGLLADIQGAGAFVAEVSALLAQIGGWFS